LFVLLIPILIGAAAARPDGAVGARTLRPISASEVRHDYRQSAGELELDFSSTRFRNGTTEIGSKIGAGGMVITVPDDVSVTVIAKVRTGGYNILGKQTNAGIGQSETLRFEGCPDAPHLRLNLKAGAGWMQVKRANGLQHATCPKAA
jgi:hypothetical protein